MKAKGAGNQLIHFEIWCLLQEVLPISESIIVLAADLYAGLKRRGQLIGDNDLLIAATALHQGWSLATGNVAHFSRIPGLVIDDWTKP